MEREMGWRDGAAGGVFRPLLLYKKRAEPKAKLLISQSVFFLLSPVVMKGRS